MKVLLIEDNEIQKDFLTSALADDEFEVISTSDAMRAIELAVCHMPDLIITDISMPVKSGLELARDFKGYPLLANIPVLAVSADTSVDSVKGALHAGIVDYIEKPIKSDYLKRLIRFHSSTNRINGALSEWQAVLDNVAARNNQIDFSH